MGSVIICTKRGILFPGQVRIRLASVRCSAMQTFTKLSTICQEVALLSSVLGITDSFDHKSIALINTAKLIQLTMSGAKSCKIQMLLISADWFRRTAVTRVGGRNYYFLPSWCTGISRQRNRKQKGSQWHAHMNYKSVWCHRKNKGNVLQWFLWDVVKIIPLGNFL